MLQCFLDDRFAYAPGCRRYVSGELYPREQVMEGRSILGLYPATEEQTRDDFAVWRKANNR